MTQKREITDEMIEAGAQALVNHHWHPPQKLSVIGDWEAKKYRYQARLVLEAALLQNDRQK